MTIDTDKERSHHHQHPPHRHRPTTSNHTPNTSTTTTASTSSTTGELLICFSTSRLSSSMKISSTSSSKSIPSPSRRDQISLSASLSHRLRTNGSIKGGQASPMFPAGAKKRGGSFENPEPSSPKVTCIGQVRVKTKKQSKKMATRSLSRRRSVGAAADVSFKRLERGISDNGDSLLASGGGIQFQQYECLPPGRNQRWVHLPVTICDALRAFGSEFNCFLPCRSSSCLAGGEDSKDKEEKSVMTVDAGESGNRGSCGTVFARWLVAVQERDVKGRDIDLVAVRGGGEEKEKEDLEEEEEESSDLEIRRRSYRRHHGFEEIDLDLKEEDVFAGANKNDDGGEVKSRMSICVPPKNALLLMRCRSDPVKMAALANKFWNPPGTFVKAKLGGNNEVDGIAEQGNAVDGKVSEDCVAEMEVTVTVSDNDETKCEEAIAADELHTAHESAVEQIQAPVTGSGHDMKQDEEQESIIMCVADEEGIPINGSTNEEEEEEEEEEVSDLEHETTSVQENGAGGEEPEPEPETTEEDNGADGVRRMAEDSDLLISMPERQVVAEESEKELDDPEIAAAAGDEQGSEPESPKAPQEPSPTGRKSKERESKPGLPDCLLLMMCEPKVSMEVSKETWVCSTDFVRWLPEPSRQVAAVKKTKCENLVPSTTNKISTNVVDVNPPAPPPPLHKTKIALQFQPPRSSCSYPARPPVWRPGAESIDEGLDQQRQRQGKNSKAYMLTRCKSEPRKTAAKLAPEACCWKNRKLEPQLRIGAAGVGF